jgi:hypothetical protein
VPHRAVQRTRIGAILASAILAVVAGGCGSTPATPTIAQCVAAWNHGQIATTPGLQVGQSPSAFGYLGRRVWVSPWADPGAGDDLPSVGCSVAFDLGGGRVVLFASRDLHGDDASAARAAARGLLFDASGVAGDWIMPIAAARLFSTVPGSERSQGYGAPDACQGDDGVVRVSGCPPHAPTTHASTFFAWRNQIHATAVGDVAAQGPTWWLGLTFRGFGANAGPQFHPGRQVVYEVESGKRAWQIWVITVDSHSPAPPGCATLRTVGEPSFCWHGRLVGRLLASLHPDASHAVVVYAASWRLKRPADPLPAAIADQVRAALRPVQLG